MVATPRIWITGLVIGCGLSCATSAVAQSKPAPDPRATRVTPRNPEAIGTPELLQKLAGQDAAARKQAIDFVKDRLANLPTRAADQRAAVFKALTTNRHYADAADLAWFGIAATPHDTRAVEFYQQQRVRALLASGKADEALQAAKGLFNVATMAGTSDAILLVAECLNAARPGDKQAFDKFRQEQMSAAAANVGDGKTPAQIAAEKGPQSTVLASIKVDPKPYDELLAKWTAEDFPALMARGNLQLLADRPDQARELFERAYSLASPQELLEASEALARVIRAQDGTIARANAWVLAIRPKGAVTK